MMSDEERRARHREEQQRWRAANLEKAREIARESTRRWREKNREKARKSSADASRRCREAKPEEARAAARARYHANPDLAAFNKFMARQRHPGRETARKKAYAERHPEKHRKQRNNTPSAKRHRKEYARRRTIRETKDKAALGERIIANARAAIPANVGPELRAELAAMIAQRVYEGRYPIRVTTEQAKEVMTDHFRMFTKYGPESLDAPRFDDGSGCLHDTISKGLWS